jgi:hypothetical protein
LAGNGTRDETWVICDRGTGVGDLHRAPVGHGLEQSEERDLMRGKTGIRRR